VCKQIVIVVLYCFCFVLNRKRYGHVTIMVGETDHFPVIPEVASSGTFHVV
jgi:hypothetical protein